MEEGRSICFNRLVFIIGQYPPRSWPHILELDKVKDVNRSSLATSQYVAELHSRTRYEEYTPQENMMLASQIFSLSLSLIKS